MRVVYIPGTIWRAPAWATTITIQKLDSMHAWNYNESCSRGKRLAQKSFRLLFSATGIGAISVQYVGSIWLDITLVIGECCLFKSTSLGHMPQTIVFWTHCYRHHVFFFKRWVSKRSPLYQGTARILLKKSVRTRIKDETSHCIICVLNLLPATRPPRPYFVGCITLRDTNYITLGAMFLFLPFIVLRHGDLVVVWSNSIVKWELSR